MALTNDTNNEVVEPSEHSFPNSSDPSFSLGLPVTVPSLDAAFQRQQSSPKPPFKTPAVVLFVSTSVTFTVMELSASVAALGAVGLPPTLAPPSDPISAGVSSATSMSLGSPSQRVFPSHLPLLATPDTTATTGLSLCRHLTTVKRRCDDARRDSAAVLTKLQKVSDKNDELCYSLPAPREALPTSHLSFMDPMLQLDFAA